MPDSAPSSVVSASTGAEPKSWLEKNTPSLIALLVVSVGLYILGWQPDNKAALIAPIISFVLGYFFGTGIGSQAKDKVIAAMKQAK